MTDALNSNESDHNRIVCFCHNVQLKALLEAIRAGATSHEAIKEKTHASTGCTGCEWDVLEILRDELERQKGCQKG